MGITNATIEIQEEAKNTSFTKIIDVENCTVVSGVTNSTYYTYPQHLKDSSAPSGNGQFSRGSSSSPPPTPMVLEGQEEDKEAMDVGSNGKNDDNQPDEASEQSQEPKVNNTKIITSSPRREIATAAEIIMDKQGKEVQQINADNHIKEGRGRGEGRGGGRGGRGRRHFNFQGNQAGRGGETIVKKSLVC